MKINEDCIRDIMKLLVDDLLIFVDKKKVELGKLSIYYISSCFSEYFTTVISVGCHKDWLYCFDSGIYELSGAWFKSAGF